jgi:hypothetical protein
LYKTPAALHHNFVEKIKLMERIVFSHYYPEQKLLVTRLSGLLNSSDINAWKDSLYKASEAMPDNSSFKILVDLHGFKAENFEVHKEYRTIMPLFLAEFGYRIGYLDMFPEASVELKNNRGIRCVAMANVHQDESKMKDYQEKFSKAFEQYFTDSRAGTQWINSYHI